MRPKRKPKKKKQPIEFDRAYFQKNKEWFNPSFIRIPLRERSGMLAKYFRKLDLVEKRLANAELWMKSLLEKNALLTLRQLSDGRLIAEMLLNPFLQMQLKFFLKNMARQLLLVPMHIQRIRKISTDVINTFTKCKSLLIF